ncbi:hypothetical protein [Aquimarina agarivorans]|uniref:hypothetical protein n=1 Tax=Aquimarina agarivorans TaxID=980584 RepID=UPI000248E67D|nr:hypothetical protein [Aquimarina agarivorans]
MKVLVSTLLILTNILSSIGQEIQIIKKTDSIPKIKEKGLAYINPETKLNDYYFIAKIKIESNNFNTILSKLQRASIDLNANAFRLVEKDIFNNKTSIIVDLYAANLDLVKSNSKLNESNVIYFFGNDSKNQKIKIKKTKIELNPGQIYRYEIPKNEEIKINIGGITGETVYHKWKENQSVIFYAFGAGNLSTSGNGYSTVNLNINTGKIFELKTDFAKLLMELKK